MFWKKREKKERVTYISAKKGEKTKPESKKLLII